MKWLLAEVLASRPPKAKLTRANFCRTPTWLCTKRNPKVAVRGAGLRRKWRSMRKRAEISKSICAARLSSGLLELYYQPLFNLKTKRIVTREELLRWPHHQRGMISPTEFIPLAEDTGLIVEIGKRVLHKACAECRRWPGNTAVAVNFSPIQFERSNVPALVRETLDATKLAASRLEIEITEFNSASRHQ